MKVKAVAVQWMFRLDDYSSSSSFRSRVLSLMKMIDDEIGLDENSLVVFPEHIGSFLLFMDYVDKVRACTKLEEAARRMALPNILKLLLLRIIHRCTWNEALVMLRCRKAFRAYVDAFSEASREFETYVVAGSIIVPRMSPCGELLDHHFYNTSYVFNPEGDVVGIQRKVHLVDFEKEIGISPASIEDVKAVKLEWGRIGVAICYDAFFNDVLKKLSADGAHILVQPSANPEPWTPKLEEEWRKGCWLAVQEFESFLYGVNPMAVGRMFELEFQGRSSIVAKQDMTPDRSGYLAIASNPVEEGFVYAELDLR